MYWKINSLFVFLVLSACNPTQQAENNHQIPIGVAVRSPYLIEVNDLMKITGNSNMKLIDFRKKERYLEGHIAGALTIWRPAIEDASFPYSGIMASPVQIEMLFSELGIQSDDTLIIYDDNGLVEAARLWWILQNYDFTNVKLLHGGIAAWKENGGAVSTDAPQFIKTAFQLSKSPSMKYHISKEELLRALPAGLTLLDTRSLDEYSGKRQKEGAAKAGRIPNSIHIDWSASVNFPGDKKFRPIEELRSIYGQLAVNEEDTIIVYCHSGVRSAHTTFVLTQLLDYKNVKNYDGSWSEWSYFDDLEFVSDSATTLIN